MNFVKHFLVMISLFVFLAGYSEAVNFHNFLDPDDTDTLPPVPVYQIDCGDILHGTVKDIPDEEFRANLAQIYFDTETSMNYTFSHGEIVRGETPETDWELKVIDKSKDARAKITFVDRNGNDTTIIIEYHAHKLEIDPPNLDFGNLKIGEEKTLTIRLINKSDTYECIVKIIELLKRDGFFEITGIEGDDNFLPFILMPFEEFEITITFNATEYGDFNNMISAGDGCYLADLCEVSASVGEPVISVGDADFYNVKIGEKRNKTITIQNIGKSNLHITGFKDFTDPAFTHDLSTLKLDDENPLVIKHGDNFDFTVFFKPTKNGDYTDSIVFETNANGSINNVCVVTGMAIKPDLIANNYDWGRLRIHRPGNPVGPYDTDYIPGQEQAIKIYNPSSQKVTINDLNIDEKNPGDMAHFIIPNDLKTGFTMQPGEERLFSVLCQPTTPGEHQITITFNNSLDSKTQSILRCYGVVPKLKTQDVYFGVSNINNEEVITKKVRVTNQKYEFEDIVTINDIKVDPAGAVSLESESFGSQGFRFDKSSLNLPVELAPGESLEFNVDFRAVQAGSSYEATLTTDSDALEEVTATLTGSGILIDGLEIDVTEGFAEFGECDTIYCTLKNVSDEPIDISSIYFDPVDDNFVLLDPEDIIGFVLQPGEEKTIRILYCPFDDGKQETELVLETSLMEDPEVRVPVVGNSITGVKDYVFESSIIRNVYPNPADDGLLYLKLDIKNAAKTGIIIYDSRGKVVQRESITVPGTCEYEFTIPVKSLSPGAYILKVINGNAVGWCKLIIE